MQVSPTTDGTRTELNGGIPFTQLRLLVFDLDGTLVDSRGDLVASVNATLVELGRQPLPEEVIASYVGDGAPLLVRRALGWAPPSGEKSAVTPALTAAQQQELERALGWFLDYYSHHLLDHTRLYEGMEELLREAAGQAIFAVLTNKPAAMSEQILRGLGVRERFARVYGGDSFAVKKPDPTGLRALLEEFSVTPEETLMIGDSHVDMRTGHNAGVWTCGVTWGFAPATLAVHAPHRVVECVQELAALMRGGE